MTNEQIKARTIELYDQLPMELEARQARHDIRDEILQLNYAFFGYLASTTFINNNYISYEDKLNTAIVAWLEMWWKYRWTPKYRADLAFTVFFKPRITEVMDRRLGEVKYSIRRPLCIEVGDQIGKHWAKVTYEDLSDPRVKLSPDKMNSIKAVFGSLYSADLETHALYMEADKVDLFDTLGVYDSIQGLLINEMIENECKLDDKKLRELADMLTLDFDELKKELPKAEADLYRMLHDSLDIHDTM